MKSTLFVFKNIYLKKKLIFSRYGQTGTGKTYTMEGFHSVKSDDPVVLENDPHIGIIPRAVSNLFSSLNSISNCEYSVKVSFIELYNEELSDLLSLQSVESGEKLRIFDDPARKGSVTIPNLEETIVQNKAEVFKILDRGAERRQKAATLMNAQSSRSHSIFTVTVYIKEKSVEGEETVKVGKLNLVDLAGSENIERSGASGKRAVEAGKINKSLTTLGRVITALVEHRDHIPYRESNLTRLLQDSLGGRTKTTIIATISPSMVNIEETLSTLDYAHKAKSIRNKPEINQKLVRKALIKEYNEEIDRLKKELTASRDKNGIYMPPEMYDEIMAQKERQKEEIRELSARVGILTEDLDKANETCCEYKEVINERTHKLTTTENILKDTRQRLEYTERVLEETRYIVDVRVRNESQLFSQAEALRDEKCAAQNECLALHEKIRRLEACNAQNRALTTRFVSNLSEKCEDMSVKDGEVNKTSRSHLCHVCSILNTAMGRLGSVRDQSIEHINEFNDRQAAQVSFEILIF
jgi:kinesin family protein 11